MHVQIRQRRGRTPSCRKSSGQSTAARKHKTCAWDVKELAWLRMGDKVAEPLWAPSASIQTFPTVVFKRL